MPQELSLVCYEGIRWLHTWLPPITVVDNGARQLADLAMDLLLGQLERPMSTPLDTVGAALIERNSTLPLTRVEPSPRTDRR